MSRIIFEGVPPYDLSNVQSAEARAVDDIVELVLTVFSPEALPASVRVRVILEWETAQRLGIQLGPVAATAERNSRMAKL